MKKTVIVLTAVLLLLLSACSGGENDTQKKTHLNVLATVSSVNYNPTANAQTDPIALQSIYDGLVRFDKDAKIVPHLAESFTESEDGMTFTFKLREDVVFHDGSKFTADDVVFTLDTMKAEPACGPVMLPFISSWEKVDEYTVNITRPNPLAVTLNYLASQVLIVPDETFDAEKFATQPVGCGPYKFVSMGTDGSTELEAFDKYFAGEPEMKTVTIKAPLDESAAIMGLQTGDIDLITRLSPAQYNQIKGDDKYAVEQFEGWSTMSLLMMGDRFNGDPELRFAIGYAVNRQNAVDLGASGLGTVSDELFAARVMGEYAGKTQIIGQDEQKAQEHLAKAADASSPITLTITSDIASVAQSVQSDLKALGLNVEIEQLDVNSFYTRLFAGEVEMTIMRLGTMQMSVDTFIPQFASTSMLIGNAIEVEEEFDQIAVALTQTTDKAELDKLCVEGLEGIINKMVYIPLYTATDMLAYSKSITNVNAQGAGTYVYYLDEVKAS